jgi:hypothetical protein
MLAGTVSPLRDISTHTRESSMDRMNKPERQVTHLWFEDVPQQACPLQACTKGLLHKLAMFSCGPRRTPHNLNPWPKRNNSTRPCIRTWTACPERHARNGNKNSGLHPQLFLCQHSRTSEYKHIPEVSRHSLFSRFGFKHHAASSCLSLQFLVC